MPAAVLHAGLLALRLCASPPPPAALDQLELDWDVPAQCPGRDEQLARIAKYVDPDAASHPLAASAEIVQSQSGWQMRLTMDAHERSLEAATCDELARAAAVIISLALTPEAPEPEPEQLDRLRSRLGLDQPPPPSDVREPPSSLSGWKVAVALIIAVGLAGGVAQSVHRSANTSPRPLEVVTQEPSPASAPSSQPPVIVPVASEPSPPADAPLPRSRSIQARSAEPRPRDKSSTEPAPPTSLDAELELIAAARLALRQRELDRCEALSDRYLAGFPAGTFVEEASVLRLLARCSAGATETDLEQARAYLDGPQPRFAARVRRACTSI